MTADISYKGYVRPAPRDNSCIILCMGIIDLSNGYAPLTHLSCSASSSDGAVIANTI